MDKQIHIISRGSRWALKKKGGKRAMLLCDTVRECIDNTFPLRTLGWKVILHRRDGTVRDIIVGA